MGDDEDVEPLKDCVIRRGKAACDDVCDVSTAAAGEGGDRVF